MNSLAQKGFYFILLWFAVSVNADWKFEWRSNSESAGSSVILSGGTSGDWKTIQDKSEGWTASDWKEMFPVYLALEDASLDLPPVSGSYQISNQPSPQLIFRPRFPWTHGATYRAVVRFNKNEDPVESIWTHPARKLVSKTQVVSIYPTAQQIPENLLKFYIQFSHPMRRGDIYQYIHLKNESGVEVRDPFLEVDEELWDPERLRLTLFIDPGRVKREVRPLEEVGPALESGKSYSLSVDADWLDEDGAKLVESFTQNYEVMEPDRATPDPDQWRYCFPPAGLHLPIRIEFGETLDQALASERIRVFHQERMEEISGTIYLLERETVWEFYPNEPWAPGAYFLLIAHQIEDLAGNQIGKPFEVSLTSPETTPVNRQDIKKHFDLR